MNKNILVVAISFAFLFASVIFSFTQKSALNDTIKRVKQESFEVNQVASLQNLWKAKGIKSKIENILKTLPSSKKERVNFKRNKVDIKLNNLSDKELNRVLTKLVMLPVQFRGLNITRNKEEFILECLCVW
jgi:hypothetical protein